MGAANTCPTNNCVRAAARARQALPDTAADALEERWPELPAWSGAQAALDALRGRTKLAVVTNCSQRLGMLAAGRLKTRWDCVVTAEEAGYYKPDPRPYRLALAKLGVAGIRGRVRRRFRLRPVRRVRRGLAHLLAQPHRARASRRRAAAELRIADPRPFDSLAGGTPADDSETLDARLHRRHRRAGLAPAERRWRRPHR